MKLPKFLLGDNSAYPDTIFVIHTDYPRFIMNIITDDLELLETIDVTDKNKLNTEMENLVQAAVDFYDNELKNYTDA